MDALKTEILDRYRQYYKTPAAGELSDDALDKLVALKTGTIFFHAEPVNIGREKVQWAGTHIRHQEWPAQLNRFRWLQVASQAYAHSGEEALAALVKAYIEDWMQAHPNYAEQATCYPGDNTLNMGVRLPGWWELCIPLFGADAMDNDFVNRLIAFTRDQLVFLEAHLARDMNWRVHQLDGILFCGLVVPGLESFATFAVRQLNEAFHQQVEADGSHIEHVPGYHCGMMRRFLEKWEMANTHPELGLTIPARGILNMLTYAFHCTAPNGKGLPLHDSGQTQFNSRVNDNRSLRDRQQFIERAGLPEALKPVSCGQWFPDAGQLFLRSGLDSDAEYLMFDATRYGGGHCHLSRQSVNYYLGNRFLLCDPGIMSYERSDPFSAYGKSTPAHNTVSLNGYNQSCANVDVRQVQVFEHSAYWFSIYQGGYCSGAYHWGFSDGLGDFIHGEHGRALVWLKGRGAVVVDTIYSDRKDMPFSMHWQFPAGAHYLDEPRQAAGTDSGDYNIHVQNLFSTVPLQTAVHEGDMDPIRGWLPNPGNGRYIKAPQLTYKGVVPAGFAEIGTVLCPCKGVRPDIQITPLKSENPGAVHGVTIAWGDGREDVICCSVDLYQQVGRTGPVDCDASLAVISLTDGRLTRAMMSRGLYLEYNGDVLIRNDEAKPVEVALSSTGLAGTPASRTNMP